MKAQSSGQAVTPNQATRPATNSSKDFASPGCVELGGSISFTDQNIGNQSSTVFLFSPYIGWFPVQGFELGFDPFSYTSVGSGANSLLVLFAPAYNFQTGSNIYPFIEGDIGMNYEGFGGSSESGLTAGVRAGIKIEIVKHAILDVSLQYLSSSQGSGGQSSGNLVVGAGFTVAL